MIQTLKNITDICEMAKKMNEIIKWINKQEKIKIKVTDDTYEVPYLEIYCARCDYSGTMKVTSDICPGCNLPNGFIWIDKKGKYIG